MRIVAATVVLLHAAPAVSAQSNAGDLTDLPLEQLLHMEVYSASRFVQDSLQAPSSVSVVTREDIRTFGFRTIAEALQSVRGTYVTYDRSYRFLGVRGFSRPGDDLLSHGQSAISSARDPASSSRGSGPGWGLLLA